MRSMTGFGAASGDVGKVKLSVEVRSVNQRFLDLKINAPREYAAWEAELRRIVSSVVARGRVEVYVNRTSVSRSSFLEIHDEVAAAYVKALRKLKEAYSLAGDIEIGHVLSRGEIFQAVEPPGDTEAEVEEVCLLLSRALAAHARERKREGVHLQRDMKGHVAALKKITTALGKRTQGHAQRTRERLESKVKELLDNAAIDPERIVQETALLAERGDVTEEIVRLAAHLDSLAELVRAEEPVAKRIDFLLQEVNRELNTIGSKASDLDVTNLVIEGKAAVEKLREQNQNVE